MRHGLDARRDAEIPHMDGLWAGRDLHRVLIALASNSHLVFCAEDTDHEGDLACSRGVSKDSYGHLTSRSSERPMSRAVLLSQLSAGVAQLIVRLL